MKGDQTMKKIALITGMLMMSTAAFGQAMIYPHPDGSYTINRPGISGYSTQVYRHPDGSYTANDEWGTTQITPQVGGGHGYRSCPSQPPRHAIPWSLPNPRI